MECKVTRTHRKNNDYTVTLKGMTRGCILAMRQALAKHAAAGSAVGADVLAFLDRGIRESNDPDVCRVVIEDTSIPTDHAAADNVTEPPPTVPIPSTRT